MDLSGNISKHMEIWKDVIGYEGLYQVSNLGRVKSLNYGREKFLKLFAQKDGYINVGLYKNGELKTYRVHRLVAQAFIPNPSNLPQVNHIDEDKTNNCINNLEWCSHQYNQEYSLAKPVAQYDLNGNLIATWKSTREAERQTGIRSTHISDCCRGMVKTTPRGKYFWRYI